MSSSTKKWRQSDGVYRETETIDNVYKYDYDTAILLYPSIAALLTREEFYKFQAKYNDSKK